MGDAAENTQSVAAEMLLRKQMSGPLPHELRCANTAPTAAGIEVFDCGDYRLTALFAYSYN